MTILGSELIARVRRKADIETATGTLDYITDDEVLQYINAAYAEMLDLILDNGGADILTVSATLSPTAYSLPADFYRARGLDTQIGGQWRELLPFNWANRNDVTDANYPRWRVVGAAIQFAPTTASLSGSLRLWYVPVASTIASGTAFAPFNGWDDYIVCRAAMDCVAKEERDPAFLGAELQRAEARITRACQGLKLSDPDTIANVARYPVDFEGYW